MAPTFPPPKGLELPRPGPDGKTFDLLATVERTADGRLRLVALDGNPLSDAEDGGFLDTVGGAMTEDTIYNG